MTHAEKIEWMKKWCEENNLTLTLEGECGFGRECVGVLAENDCYPDYAWHDYDGDVWVPDDAYHKHDCVAVLGRGEKAEAQLYDWLKWFHDNNFKLEVVGTGKRDTISLLMGADRQARMVRT